MSFPLWNWNSIALYCVKVATRQGQLACSYFASVSVNITVQSAGLISLWHQQPECHFPTSILFILDATMHFYGLRKGLPQRHTSYPLMHARMICAARRGRYWTLFLLEIKASKISVQVMSVLLNSELYVLLTKWCIVNNVDCILTAKYIINIVWK